MNEAYRVEMRGIKKSFAGIKALKGVDFSLRPGEIHALVGENGAGKSTLMKILSGAYVMDEGQILMDGLPVTLGTPRRGKDHGVGIVYQEFELADDISIAENIFIDRMGSRGIVHWKKLFSDATDAINALGFSIDTRRKVKDISVAYKQVVEIAKALSANAKILILDEPTAMLTPAETDKLFETMRRLKAAGVSIVYISHRMDEIFTICDTISIMRDGEITGGGSIDSMTVDSVVELMIGRKLEAMYPHREIAIGEELLRVEGLSGGVFSNIDFTLHRGEVLGVFGLVGSGRSEIVRAIFGEDAIKSGKLYLAGQKIRIHSPHQAIGKGIALIPENRKEQGLVLDKSIRQNITLCCIPQISKPRGIISRKKETALAAKMIERLSVKAGNPANPVKSLSGGNQQKVVIAKWLTTGAQVLIMDEPTRGVDVGAKVEIYHIMNELAAQGVGILMISSELNEVIGMCDRVMVIDNGHKQGELTKEDISEKSIMRLVVGGVE